VLRQVKVPRICGSVLIGTWRGMAKSSGWRVCSVLVRAERRAPVRGLNHFTWNRKIEGSSSPLRIPRRHRRGDSFPQRDRKADRASSGFVRETACRAPMALPKHRHRNPGRALPNCFSVLALAGPVFYRVISRNPFGRQSASVLQHMVSKNTVSFLCLFTAVIDVEAKGEICGHC